MNSRIIDIQEFVNNQMKKYGLKVKVYLAPFNNNDVNIYYNIHKLDANIMFGYSVLINCSLQELFAIASHEIAHLYLAYRFPKSILMDNELLADTYSLKLGGNKKHLIRAVHKLQYHDNIS